MNTRSGLAAMAATVVIIVALLAFGLPRLAGSGASQSPTPGSVVPTIRPVATASPAPVPTASPAGTPVPSFPINAGASGFDQLHVSPLYHYALRYPASWSLSLGAIPNAPDDLPDLASVPSRADFFSDQGGGTGGVMVTAGRISATRPDLATFSAYVDSHIPVSFLIYAAGVCTHATRTLILDGEPANESDYFCPAHSALWATTIHNGLAYQVVWLDEGPFTAAELRPRFDEFLQSFTFGP